MNFLKKYFKLYKEQILYIFFGGCTTLVNLIIYFLATRLFNIDDYISIFISWVLAVLFAYITNKIWVFESTKTDLKALLKEIISFFTARIITLLLEYLIMFIGVNLIHLNDLIVKIFAQFLVIVANYFFSKLFIFKA